MAQDDRYLDAGYLLSVFAAFDKLRIDSIELEIAYLQRLLRLKSETLPQSVRTPVACGSRLIGIWASARRLAADAMQVLRLLPQLLAQTKVFARWTSQHSGGSILLAVIASNRLSLEERGPGARATLARLVHAVGDPAETIAAKLASAQRLLIFDALPISRWWRVGEPNWVDNVIIVDFWFAAIYSAWSLVRDPRRGASKLRALKDCYRELRATNNLTFRTLARTGARILISSAYADVLKDVHGTEAFFLTAGSTLVDLLRAYLIQWPACTRMYELMHGVGSRQAEELFASILSAGERFGAYEKHFFVPQVPNLPLYGVFKRQQAFGDEVAINSYLNQRFMAWQKSGTAVLEQVATQYDALCVGHTSSNPLLIAVFGSHSYDGRLYDSPALEAERLLIELIGQHRSSLQSDCVVVYVPHPFQPLALDLHPMFAEHGITIRRDSTLAWLVADMAVGLFSSALFEAAQYGVHVFTPLTVADEFFTEGYLALVHHPESASREDLSEAMRVWLAGRTGVSKARVIARASARMRMMGWPTDEPVPDAFELTQMPSSP